MEKSSSREVVEIQIPTYSYISISSYNLTSMSEEIWEDGVEKISKGRFDHVQHIGRCSRHAEFWKS
jgi:hypothetical protein